VHDRRRGSDRQRLHRDPRVRLARPCCNSSRPVHAVSAAGRQVRCHGGCPGRNNLCHHRGRRHGHRRKLATAPPIVRIDGLGVLTSEPREHGAALASFTRWASGHSRAISRGAAGSMTVTSGASDALVRAVSGPDRSDSQVDGASSIPVTRSTVMSQDIASPHPRSLRRNQKC
jgi:hypothetical protein